MYSFHFIKLCQWTLFLLVNQSSKSHFYVSGWYELAGLVLTCMDMFAWNWSETPRVSSSWTCLYLPFHIGYTATSLHAHLILMSCSPALCLLLLKYGEWFSWSVLGCHLLALMIIHYMNAQSFCCLWFLFTIWTLFLHSFKVGFYLAFYCSFICSLLATNVADPFRFPKLVFGFTHIAWDKLIQV